MEPKQRIPLISQCARSLAGRGWSEIDFILNQFDLPTTDMWRGTGSDNADQFDYVRDMLGSRGVEDEALLSLHDYLHGTTSHDSSEEPWQAGEHLRVFLSHLWKRRDDAESLKVDLESWGIEAFVAHRDINPGAEWVRVIKAALYSCDAMVPLLHEGFNESDWCDQEVGVAIGRQVPVFPVRVEITPYGLLGSFQAISWKHDDAHPARLLAGSLVNLLLENQRTRQRTIESLVGRFVSARSFEEANGVSRKLEMVEADLSTEQVNRVVGAGEDNDQVYHAWTAQRLVKRLSSKLRIAASEDYGLDEAPF